MKRTVRGSVIKIVTAFVAVIVIAVPTVSTATASALIQNGRYYCGSVCNGTSAATKVAGQTFACADDQRVQAQATPVKKLMGVPSFNDPYMKITVYYSHRCQTMWAKVTNAKAIGRTWLMIQLNSTQSDYYKNYPTPKAGSSVVTTMIDDHSSSYGIAAALDVEESVHDSMYARYYFSY